MGGAENAILFLLSFKSEKQDVAYGQAKADAFQYLSWDNRLRYCYFHTVMCMIGRLGSVPGRNKIMEPRLQKVRKILQAVSMKAPPENFVFMDTDVVLADASTNIFEDDFFTNGMIDGERLGITMDLNYTFATRNNLPTDTQRYQTGVLFLRTTNGQSVHALLRNLLNLSKTLVRDVHSGETRSHNLSSHSLKDGDRRFSDQWLLNELVHQQPQYASIIDILQPRHVFNAFPVYEESWYSVSVQTNGSLPINVGHARPQQSSVSSYWNQLGLPRGDEIKGKSVVVHFAGSNSFLFVRENTCCFR